MHELHALPGERMAYVMNGVVNGRTTPAAMTNQSARSTASRKENVLCGERSRRSRPARVVHMRVNAV